MRLLLIEDEHQVADVIARGLRAERFAVDVAHDGNTGWQMASTVPYDLIILDLMLPGISGTEVLRRLQQKGCSAAILVLTASDSIGAIPVDKSPFCTRAMKRYPRRGRVSM